MMYDRRWRKPNHSSGECKTRVRGYTSRGNRTNCAGEQQSSGSRRYEPRKPTRAGSTKNDSNNYSVGDKRRKQDDAEQGSKESNGDETTGSSCNKNCRQSRKTTRSTTKERALTMQGTERKTDAPKNVFAGE